MHFTQPVLPHVKSYPLPLLYMLFNAIPAVLCNDDGAFTNASCSRVASGYELEL